MPTYTRRKRRYSRRYPRRGRRSYRRRRFAKRRKISRLRSVMAPAPSRQYRTHLMHIYEGTGANPSGVMPPPRNVGSMSLLKIDKGTSINNRDRDTAFVKGVLLRFRLAIREVEGATNSNDARGIQFNWAIVVPKIDTIAEPTIDGEGQYVYDNNLLTDFLRGWDASRALTLGQSISGMATLYNPLNTDKYAVLKRGSKKLWSPQFEGALDNNQRASYFEKKMFLKLNTTVAFDGTDPYPVGAKPYFVYWYDIQGRAQGIGGDINAAKELQIESYVWFKDIN